MYRYTADYSDHIADKRQYPVSFRRASAVNGSAGERSPFGTTPSYPTPYYPYPTYAHSAIHSAIFSVAQRTHPQSYSFLYNVYSVYTRNNWRILPTYILRLSIRLYLRRILRSIVVILRRMPYAFHTILRPVLRYIRHV